MSISISQRITGDTRRILLMSFLLIFGLWLFINYQTNQDYERSYSESASETMNLAIAFEEHVRGILVDANKDLVNLEQAYERGGLSDPVILNMARSASDGSARNLISVYDDQGTIIASSSPEIVGLSRSDREYFLVHLDHTVNGLYVDKTIVRRTNGVNTISLTRRVDKPDGSFGGIVYIGLKTDYFLSFYQKISLGPDQLVSLIGTDGFVRARRVGDNAETGQDSRVGEFWRRIQNGQTEASYLYTNTLDGISRITSYRVMPDYPLIVAVGKSAKVAFAGYEQRRRSYLLGATLASLFIMIFCGLLVRGSEKLRAKEMRLQAQNEELRATEGELRTSRERYQALVEQSSEAIVVYEYATCQIVEVNAAATNMFGYSAEEFLTMTPSDYSLIDDAGQQRVVLLMETVGRFPPEICRFQHKDGRLIIAERSGSMVNHQSTQYGVFIYHNITEKRLLQERIRADVELAGKVQRAMLPGDYADEKVTIKTIYEPLHLVSGDYYGYKLVRGGSLLNGYLMDVTGHGVATALQTAAASALLHKEIEKDHPWSTNSLTLLNSQLATYLPENSFAAVLVFSFDFEKKMLTCISAGINYFLAFSQNQHGWVSLPGSFLGNPDFDSYESVSIPLQHGDVFCFPTDGFFEDLIPNKGLAASDIPGIIEEMSGYAASGDRADDRTLLCLKVDAFPRHPVSFAYSGSEIREHVLHRVRQALANIVGETDFWLELALGEAETNAFRYGTKVRIKLNRIGNRLIIRVANNGTGFDGNDAVARIKAFGVKRTFEKSLSAEHGRGIPIMLMTMDSVLYNTRGTEVMLIKDLSAGKAKGCEVDG